MTSHKIVLSIYYFAMKYISFYCEPMPGDVQEIHEGHKHMAEVSKMWFHAAGTYGVDIVPDVNDILIITITVIIDMMID